MPFKPEHTPISPPIETGPRGMDLPAYVSNGLIGLRIPETPLAGGMCIVSGFVGEHHERRIQAAAPAPYPLGADLAIDGLWASEAPGSVTPLDQAYDFATGELTTRIAVDLAGKRLEATAVVYASRTHPTLVA